MGVSVEINQAVDTSMFQIISRRVELRPKILPCLHYCCGLGASLHNV